MWAIRIFHLLGVFPKALLALLAGECHLESLHELVLLGFVVTFSAVEPFSTCTKVVVSGASCQDVAICRSNIYSKVLGWPLGH